MDAWTALDPTVLMVHGLDLLEQLSVRHLPRAGSPGPATESSPRVQLLEPQGKACRVRSGARLLGPRTVVVQQGVWCYVNAGGPDQL